MKYLEVLDVVLRLLAMLVIVLMAFPVLVIVSVMGTDSGTTTSMLISLAAFVTGTAILIGVFYAAFKPRKVERKWPDHVLAARILIRIPVYLFVALGFYYYLSS